MKPKRGTLTQIAADSRAPCSAKPREGRGIPVARNSPFSERSHFGTTAAGCLGKSPYFFVEDEPVPT